MLKNKKTIFILLIILLTLSINYVSAEETKYRNDIYVDINAEENGDGTITNPYKDLQTAIDNLIEDTNINIRAGTYSGEGNTNLTITTNNVKITNYGDEEVIFTQTGDGITKPLSIKANNIILDGLKFSNIQGTSTPGGAIYWDGENAIIDNCIFENIKNPNGPGAAVYFEKGGAIVKNTQFINNTIQNLGIEVGGVITFNGANNKVTNSRFINNNGQKGGAINSLKGGLTIEDSYFTTTSYSNVAGALYLSGNDNTIKNTIFNTNNAGNVGGAIFAYDTTLTIDNCEFTKGVVGYRNGGAISIENSTFNIQNSRFFNNTASLGGAVYSYNCDGTVDNCVFAGNIGHNLGGALYLQGDNYKVINSYFGNISMNNYGGAIYINGSNSYIHNCLFENIKIGTGGAIYLADGVGSTIDNVTIKNATASSFGGAIYSRVNHTTLSNFNIIDCGNTGAINNYAVVTIYGNYSTVKDGKFENIYAINYGGCLHWPGNFGTVDNVEFINSHVTTSDGGAIFWTGNFSTINNCKFINCSANANSGSITWNTIGGTISNCIFNESSCFNGGAINSRGANNQIVNSTFENIKSTNYGAISFSGSNLLVDNCNFKNINNTLSLAGGLTISGQGQVTNSNFEDVYSANNGGSIRASGAINILNNTFTNTKAQYTGGAIDFAGNGTISGNTIINSHTQELGGGINFKGIGTISNNTFINCSVDKLGGAIYNDASSILSISNNHMINCTAGLHGHDVFNSGTIGKLNLIADKDTVYIIVNRTTFVNVKLTDDNGDDITVSHLNCVINEDQTHFTQAFTFVNNEDNATGFNISFPRTGTFILYPSDDDSRIIFNELNTLKIIVLDLMPTNLNIPNIIAHVEDTRDITIDITDANDDSVLNGTVSTIINNVLYTSTVTNGKATFNNVYLGDDDGRYYFTVNYTSLKDYYADSTNEAYINLGLYPSHVDGNDVRGIVGEVKSTKIWVQDDTGNLFSWKCTSNIL